MIVVGLVSLALAFGSDPSAAASASEPTTVDELVVHAAPTEKIQRFVDGVSASTKNGRLARWERGICPSVIGLPQKYGRFVAERMADTAFSLGLRVPVAPCRPDVVVLVTPDPDEAAARLVAEQSQAMALKPRRGQRLSGGGDQSAEAFMSSTRPVRWWHAAETQPADGGAFGDGAGPTLKGLQGYSVSSGTTSSRLGSSTKETFTQVVIVVDGRRLRGVSYEQLASYLSMVALAQIEPEPAAEDLSSILTLFDDVAAGRAAPETLTAWDTAYLKGLYAAPADARNSATQKAAIAAGMEKAAGEAE